MKLQRILLILGLVLVGFACQNRSSTTSSPSYDAARYKPFLDSLSRDTFSYFWELTNPDNGLVPDRWPTPSFSSIAATGFGLTAYLVGVERGYITRDEAGKRVLATLRFFNKAPQGEATSGITGHHGFFYHFLDMNTGLRYQQVELSTIDTGLLLAGVLSCQSYFDETGEMDALIRGVADSIYRAVEWDWAMDNRPTMSMGWHPERGFLDASWKGYNEGMILYVLALGSPTHPVKPESWQAWTSTYQWNTYFDQEYVNFGPLFGHQYSHMYIDFRGIQDDFMRGKGIDYFENSRRATLANHAYCVQNPADWEGYGEDIWGLTACDGPGDMDNANPNIHFRGYSARGAAKRYVVDDGTLTPTAAGGSIPFAPEICVPALKAMKMTLGNKLYGKYGFFDAFNLSIVRKDGTKGWFDPDYLGIDQGPILLQIENQENGFVWKLMKKNPYILEGLKKAGFSGGWLK